MRVHVRFTLLALLAGALIGVAAPAAAQAAFGIEKFVAVNCKEGAETCAQKGSEPYTEPNEPEPSQAKTEGFLTAGGRVPFGITDFKVNVEGTYPNAVPSGLLTGGAVDFIRTDVAPGLATSPSAVRQCPVEAAKPGEEEFGAKEALPESGFYAAPTCSPESKVGTNKVIVFVGENGAGPGASDLPLEGAVYNLVQGEGLASEFGVALKLPIPFSGAVLAKGFKEKEEKGAVAGVGGFPSLALQKFLEEQQYFAHTLIKGNVEWGKEAEGTNAGDYHDYFKIEVSPKLPLIRSRLVFYGKSGNGAFITNATSCPGNLTTTLKLSDVAGASETRTYTPPPPLGLEECEGVPFAPTFSLAPETTANDQPNGFSAEVTMPHNTTSTDSSQVYNASFKLPEGMTLNPSAAHGLPSACTPAQARIHSPEKGTSCPEGSELGTVSLEVPTLPPGSLTGKIYLGASNAAGTVTEPPYTIYVDAESARYGVSVRLEGKTTPNESTGQLTTTFVKNPEQPFTSLKLSFKTGPLAPIANPLTCGTATTEAGFMPYSAPLNTIGRLSSFTVSGCTGPIPFAPAQSTTNQNANAGGHTSFAFNLQRADGQQYFSKVSTTLPAGLTGAIPAVTQCEEAPANAGTCTSASQIGTATVLAGSGPTPYTFSGPVYLTGPYNGAPFGMSIVVPATAGPFSLGNVITRATINVNPTTARVTVASVLPTIRAGIPLRIKRITVNVEKQSFLYNPTNCGVMATESSVTGFVPGTSESSTVSLSSSFQVGNCGVLKFKPQFKAASLAKASKKLGASLETTINEVAGQANIKSVVVQLPKQLPSRLTTLQKACPEATFAVNPFACPSGSFVGGARANTPLLPGKLTGPAILVSHGGAKFPDLDLVMQANGVRVIVVGNTNIKNGITTTTFASTPDVPVSSITVNLPLGEHSALAAYGNLCAQPLVMPTTITGQNGTPVKQNTIIGVKGCGVRIVGHKVVGNVAYITVQTYAPGRVSGSGFGLGTVYRYLGRAQRAATIKVPLRRGRPARLRLRVGFLPKQRSLGSSAAFVTVSFR